jgi:hypothetical protein
MQRNLRIFTITAASSAFLIAAFAGPVTAADIIDQQQTATPQQVRSTSFAGTTPIGQEFTPGLNSIEFVDFFIEDAGSDVGPGASFQVKIHSNTIGGTVVGTSNTTFVTDGTNTGGGTTYTRFTFPSPVALTPGSLYVFDVLQLAPVVSGNINFGLGGRTSDSYAGGRAITDGTAEPNFDYNFREGLVPEPAAAGMLATVGAVGLLRRSRRRGA